MSSGGVHHPSDDLALKLTHLAKDVDDEPAENFTADDELRTAAVHLQRLLRIRIRESDRT